MNMKIEEEKREREGETLKRQEKLRSSQPSCGSRLVRFSRSAQIINMQFTIFCLSVISIFVCSVYWMGQYKKIEPRQYMHSSVGNFFQLLDATSYVQLLVCPTKLKSLFFYVTGHVTHFSSQLTFFSHNLDLVTQVVLRK